MRPPDGARVSSVELAFYDPEHPTADPEIAQVSGRVEGDKLVFDQPVNGPDGMVDELSLDDIDFAAANIEEDDGAGTLLGRPDEDAAGDDPDVPPVKYAGGTAAVSQPVNVDQVRTAAGAARALQPEAIGKNLTLALEVASVQTGKLPARWLGSFQGDRMAIRLRDRSDVDTLFHEQGHALDHRQAWSQRHVRDAVGEELKALGIPTSSGKASAKRRRQEGVAEFTRRWLVGEENQLRVDAPEMSALWDRFIASGSESARALGEARNHIAEWQRLSPAERLEARIVFAKDEDQVDKLRRDVNTFFRGTRRATTATQCPAGWLASTTRTSGSGRCRRRLTAARSTTRAARYLT